MPEQWLSYRQLADLWSTTPEAARARARRGRFQRRTTNTGVVEIQVDTDAPVPEARQKALDGQNRASTPSDTPNTQTPSTASVRALEALESHIGTLKDQLAKAEATAATERERVADLTAQLLKITVELLEARKTAEAPPPRSWWQRLVG